MPNDFSFSNLAIEEENLPPQQLKSAAVHGQKTLGRVGDCLIILQYLFPNKTPMPCLVHVAVTFKPGLLVICLFKMFVMFGN